jgi:DNA-binding MarR family transcriptional regulator
MVSLNNFFRNLKAKLSRLNLKRIKSFLVIGLCFSLITVSALAVVGDKETEPEGETNSNEILTNDEIIDKLDKEQQGDPDCLGNKSLGSFLFIMPLYSKLNTSDIFSNNYREDILSLITNNAGITLGAITRKLKIKTGTAAHHIRILEREGYIKSRKTGKFRRYYRIGVMPSGYNEIQDDIISTVKKNPGITQSEIARELHLSRQLVNYHMKNMDGTDIIKIERAGNKSICSPNEQTTSY